MTITKQYIDDKTVITVPKNFIYFSEFLDDLPHNAYIDKQVTGCGGTTLVLTNKESYVVAVHSKAMVYNKSIQHKNVLGMTGDTKDEEITDYLKGGWVKKIIVTYDSLPRLLKFIDPTFYRLLVDEVQVLIRYAGEFKMKVCNDLLNSTYKFKSTSFLTATPTKRNYLPKSLQELEYVEYVWKAATKPLIKHAYVGNQLNTKVISFILDKYNNTDKEVYVFYNSRSGVASAIKKLIKAEPNIKLDDIHVIFADNDENNEYFRKMLGKHFKITYPLNRIGNEVVKNNKRINFVSSFGFEGIDFYCENPITLIVSNSQAKSMRYDISIDLPQIVGRFRSTRENPIDNEIYFIWNTYTDQVRMSEEEFIEDYKITRKNMEDALSDENRKNPVILKAMASLSNSDKTPHLYVDGEDVNGLPNVQLNQYAFESLMSSFAAMHCDYYTIDKNLSEGDIEETNVYQKVTDVFSTVSDFTIPPLDLKYTKNLDRVFNFKKLCQEYTILQDKMNANCTQQEYDEYRCRRDEILLCSDDLSRYLSVLSYDRLSANGYNKQRLEKEYSDILFLKNNDFKTYLSLEVNKSYSVDDLKCKIQSFYDINGVNKKAKTTDLDIFYEYKKTSLTGNVYGIKILGIK
ncbi:MAG: hypothetical protein E6R13_06515 [Spirochaetes bacterium]|nr:MAG: hypothetical protein E6R13_06515 [Spirochaetota bacterium]